MRRGGQPVSGRSPQLRRAVGRARSPAQSKTSISWGCERWPRMWLICAKRSRCWRTAARCAQSSWSRSATSMRAPGDGRRRRGYRDSAERFAKTRRLAALRVRLAAAEAALKAGHPSVVVGGKRLWRNLNHLDAAQITATQWRDRWDAARMFLTADGESGKPGGNETIRVDEAGRLRIKTPVSLADKLGSHVVIDSPVRFTHRGQQWSDRVAARQAVRYDIRFDPERGRWYLDASWKTTPEPAPTSSSCVLAGCSGWISTRTIWPCCVLDASGNPVGDPTSIEVCTSGTGRRLAVMAGCARRSPACSTRPKHRGCAAIVVENLDFADTRATGRETLGRGQRGKRLRRTVAGYPHRRVPHPAHRDGRPAWHRRDRGGCGLHQPLGEPTLESPFAATDFRSGHRDSPSRRGGRDRATWPRLSDQASAGRTPQRTADRCGHTTGQARPASEDHTRVP